MTWEEIRRQHPRQWLLVEALKARTESRQRLLEDLAVVKSFPDAGAAMAGYRKEHRSSPERELYVLHTDRETLDISEMNWLGLRTA